MASRYPAAFRRSRRAARDRRWPRVRREIETALDES
jgi:hypothetical protein